jgi:hypothetical protein
VTVDQSASTSFPVFTLLVVGHNTMISAIKFSRDLVAFHTALKRGLLEREVAATLKTRGETAWGKTPQP